MGCTSTKNISRKANLKPTQSPTAVSLKTFVKVSKGDKYSKYIKTNILGRGAYSKVYLSKHKATNQKFALKVMRKEGLSSDMLNKEFKVKEAEIMRTLDHPNIVKCVEVVEDEKKITLVQEFVEGGNLLDYRRAMCSKIDERIVACLTKQLLSALVYIHDRNIVHRDIKLESVFLASYSEAQVKIGDFGVAIIKEPNIPLSGLRGTAIYMAPEIFTDKYNEKVDIWSLGILFYILLKGKLPYKVKDKFKVMETVESTPFDLSTPEAQSLPSLTLSFLQGLLKLDPKERFSAREALTHPWLQQYNPATPDLHSTIISKITNIEQKSILKKILSLYICSFSLEHKDLSEILKFFKEIDKDDNGTIEKKEFIEELKLGMDEENALKITERFFDNFDLNGNGVIDYTEFLTAMCEEKEVLNEKHVSRVFGAVGRGKEFVTGKEIEKWGGVGLKELMVGMKDNARLGFKNLKSYFNEF